MQVKFVCRKPFSVHADAFYQGDEVPAETLKKIPNWRKMVTGGWVLEEPSDER